MPYKIFCVANIKNVHWVYIVFAALLAGILPIFADLYLFYDKNIKKFFFLFTLYRVPIFGGYGEKIQGGFVLHISDKKAVILPYSSIAGMRSQFNLRKDYYFRKLFLLTECGSKNAPFIPFFYAFSANILTKIVGAVSQTTGGETQIKNNTIVYEDDSVFKISFRLNAVFNLITVFITLIKIILRKLEQWIMKTK